MSGNGLRLLGAYLVLASSACRADPALRAPADPPRQVEPATVPSAPASAATSERACQSKSDCPYTEACIDHRCGPCSKSEDCRSDSICHGGRCLQGPM